MRKMLEVLNPTLLIGAGSRELASGVVADISGEINSIAH
jgi:hypothetical protein